MSLNYLKDRLDDVRAILRDTEGYMDDWRVRQALLMRAAAICRELAVEMEEEDGE